MSNPTHRKLDVETEAVLAEGPDERIQFLSQDRWVPYPAASSIIRTLDDLVAHPHSTRMPCVALVGRPDNGKTTLVRRFMARHAAIETDVGIHCPVIRNLMPSNPDEAALWSSLLTSLGVLHRADGPLRRLRDQSYRVLVNMQVRVWVIDEFHHLISSSQRQQEGVVAALKNISTDLSICLVLVGTVEVGMALRTDAQLATRFKPKALRPWTLNQTYQQFLATYEMHLPLRHASGLGSADIATAIFRKSRQTIGGTKAVLFEAARAAIQSGEERIDTELLKSITIDSDEDFDDLPRLV